MGKPKKSLEHRIKRLKRLYRLKKKKMIVKACAYSAIAVVCLVLLASVGKKNESVSVSTTGSDTSANPTQITDMQTESTTAPTTVNEHDIEWLNPHNFHISYDGIWGVDMHTVEINMGTPDVYGENYMVYKNILFDIYSADAVFNFKDQKFESAAIAIHDTESVTLSDFQYIRELLANKYGDYEEDGNLHDFTKKLNGHIKWEQSNSWIILSLSNVNTKCDIILTYSSACPYLPSRKSLETIINSSTESPTNPMTAPSSETVIRRSSDYNANVDYGEYWEYDMAAIESEFGIPDEYGENSLIYKSILFGAYNSEVNFTFDDNGLCGVIVNFNSYYFALEDRLKVILQNKFGKVNVDMSRSYSTWITTESTIKLYTSKITYTKR